MSAVAAFTEEQTCALTGLSRWRLRRWAATNFFKPEIADRGDGQPVALYSFRDLVGLRVLAVLRDKHKVPLSELKRVGKWLHERLMLDKPWSSLRFFVSGREVFFHDPATSKPVSARPLGQGAFEAFEIEPIVASLEKDLASMKARKRSSTGKIEQHRGILGNASTLAGTRVPTAAIWAYHEAGSSVRDILRQYPTLSPADIQAAIEFERKRRRRSA